MIYRIYFPIKNQQKGMKEFSKKLAELSRLLKDGKLKYLHYDEHEELVKPKIRETIENYNTPVECIVGTFTYELNKVETLF